MPNEATNWIALSDSIGASTPNPIDSLWGSETLALSYQIFPKNYTTSSIPFSLVSMLFILLLLFNYRAIYNTVPTLIKGLFNFNFQQNMEVKLAFVRERDLVRVLALFSISLFMPFLFEHHFLTLYSISKFKLFFYIALALYIYLLFRKLAFSYFGWLFKQKKLFVEIRKTGFNYIILYALASVPIIIISLVGVKISEDKIAIYLIIWLVLLLFSYLYKVYRLLKEGKFSPLFNILYLCLFELALPIVSIELLFSFFKV